MAIDCSPRWLFQYFRTQNADESHTVLSWIWLVFDSVGLAGCWGPWSSSRVLMVRNQPAVIQRARLCFLYIKPLISTCTLFDCFLYSRQQVMKQFVSFGCVLVVLILHKWALKAHFRSSDQVLAFEWFWCCPIKWWIYSVYLLFSFKGNFKML